MDTLPNVNTRRGWKEPSHAGFASNVSPKVQSQQVENSHTGDTSNFVPKENHHWFVLRALYGHTNDAVEAQNDEFDKATFVTLNIMDKIELKAREDEIVKMVTEFCNDKIDAEYAALSEKMVRKLGRKRSNPLERGRLEIWAAAVVYTVATMNFLFDKSFEPYLPSSGIHDYFGTSSSTVSQKAAQIRTMLKLRRYWEPEFSTENMQANNPFNFLILL